MYASMDKLVGLQRALETGLLQCKDEVLQTFGARLHHACNQAEEVAVQKSWELIVPHIAALEQSLEVRCQNMQGEINLIRDELKDLSGSQDGTRTEVGAARADLEKLTSRLNDFSFQLSAETNVREEHGKEVFRQFEGLRSDISDERLQRSEGEGNVACRFSELSEDFRSSLAVAMEKAVRSLSEHSEKASQQRSDLENKFDAIIKAVSENADVQLQDAANQLQKKIHEAVTQMEENQATSANNTQSMISESAAALRSAIDSSANTVTAAAESLANQNLEASCEQLQTRINQLEARSKRLVEESNDTFNDALRSAEERLASVDNRLLLDVGNLRNAIQRSDVLRGALRKTVQAESIQVKREHQEMTKTSSHARDKIEARLKDQVAELSTKVTNLEKQLSRQSEGLFTELQKLPTTQDVSDSSQAVANHCNVLKGDLVDHSKKLESMGGALDARCTDVHAETSKVKLHLDQQISALSSEVTSIRQASTSLARGVVEALQIIGLFDVAPSSVALPRPPEADSGIGLQDLLAWEKAGNSLAVRVAQQWKAKDLAGTPTMLAALKHRLAVEEHAVAIELIRHASNTSLSKVVKVQAPPTPASSVAPASVVNMRQQRVIPQTSNAAQ